MQEKTSKANYEAGVKHGMAGRYEEAIAAFQGAIRNAPANADAHFGLGHAYYDTGRWKEAAEAFKRAVALAPKDFEAYLYLGASYFRLGQYEPAIEAYKGAVLVNRRSVDARHNIASAFLKMKLYEPAITYYTDALAYRPRSSEVYNDLGVAYGESGKYEKAVDALKRATSLDSDDAYAQSNLAIVYYLQGQYDDAAKAFDRAARLAPNDSVVRSNLKLADAELSRGGAALGQPVSLVNAGGESAAEGLRWLSHSDVVRGIREQNDGVKATAAPVSAVSEVATAVSDSAPPRGGMSPAAQPNSEARPEVRPADAAPATLKEEPSVSHPAPAAAKDDATLVNLYRVGVGDVLDIRLLNANTDQSTLYTVMAGGLLDYPALGETVNAAGKTTDEIAAHIALELQRRALETDPRVLVNVREYASHTVIISGLVAEPGAKVIRREAVPLYVIVADAQPLPDAARVAIMSYATGQTTHVALNDQAAMNMLVRPGDVLAVSKNPRQFYYVTGDVSSPGQKEFHEGITLTQAIMAAGGQLHKAQSSTRAWTRTVLSAGVISPAVKRGVSVTREGAGGRLVTTIYNLSDIVSGKEPDPPVKPGDRIEVRR